MSPGKIMNISHEADILSLPEFTQDSSEEGHVYRKDSGKEALGEYLIFGNLKNSSYEENSLDRLIEFIDFREDIPLSNSQITLNNEFENSNNFNLKDYNINDNDPSSFFNNVTENSFSSTDFHDAFSVLGVDLDFCYNDMTESNTLLNQDLDKLINDTVIDLEMKDFGYDLFENDAFTVLDDNIYEEENDAENLNLNLNSSRNLQILNMFPHIKDERNRRRRSLLYESRYKTTDPLRNKLKTNNTQNKIEFEKTNTHNINQNFNQVNKTDDKYFSCPIASCDKCYAKLSHLKAHLRRHSGEKPFACNWINCSWKFSRSDELARHKRSHSGIKPYKCELCEKAFARSDHLAKHKKVHKKKMTLYGTNHIKNRSKYNGIKSL